MKSVGQRTSRYLTVDMMRFLAALAVVWNHAWNLSPASRRATGLWRVVYQSASFGPDAVRVFSAISGYWITASIMRKIVAGTLNGGQVFPPGLLALTRALGISAFLIAVAWAFSRVTEKHTGWMRRRLTALLARFYGPHEKSGGAGA